VRWCLALVAALALAAPALAAEGGKSLYGEYCLRCHGANGEGVSQSRQRGSAFGPSLRGVGALAADFYLRTGYMPLPHAGIQPRRRAHLLLADDQIAALIAYVASLGRGPAIPSPHPERGSLAEGQQLFTEFCAGCHQVAARGGYVGDAVAPPLDRATAVQIAEAIRIGPYVMPRFTRRQLSDAQVSSIVRYVRYAAGRPDNAGGWGIGVVGPIPEGIVAWLVGGAAAVAACLMIGRRLRS
jgi:quinol---cytochrome-c reductase cytochrome c subunit